MSSNSRSPVRLVQPRPMPNRHASNSVCSQMYASLAQRKESAKKLLKAIELSEHKSKHSVHSLRNRTIDLSPEHTNHQSQKQLLRNSQELNNLQTASTTQRQSRSTLYKKLSARPESAASSMLRTLRGLQSNQPDQSSQSA